MGWERNTRRTNQTSDGAGVIHHNQNCHFSCDSKHRYKTSFATTRILQLASMTRHPQTHSFNMETRDYYGLYLFGDQTFDVEPHLHKLLAARNTNAVLRDFLDKAYDTIRSQIFHLPKDVRHELPSFTDIEDLLLWKPSEDSTCCVPLDMALTCLYQLGSFIMQ